MRRGEVGNSAFRTLYDLQEQGGVPPYSVDDFNACLFAFAFVSIFILALCLASWKNDKRSLWLIPVLGAGIAIYLGVDRWDRHATLLAIQAGKAKSIEGCISGFVTNKGDLYASRSSRRDEEWDVGGQHFGYKVTSNAPGYHQREAKGGVVHDHQYLRVGYIVSPILRRTEIIKIELGSIRCS
jgi:hypothetical protein